MFELNPKKEAPMAAMEGLGGGANSLLFNHTPRVYAVGQVVFDGNNTNATWTVPANVYSISVVAVGKGDGGHGPYAAGNGGGLAYANDIAVTPGATLTYTTHAAGTSYGASTTGTSTLSGPASGGQAAWTVNGPSAHHGTSGDGWFTGTPGSSRNGQKGGNYVANGSGWGGAITMAGGAGAAGYSGDGGTGVLVNQGGAGAGGGGGAGGGENIWGSGGDYAGGGGGVGLLGEGSSGTGGGNGGYGGYGGSGGADGTTGTGSPDQPGNGGNYGGGGGGYKSGLTASSGGGGGIRIIYPGHERQYPSTRTANE
tara:strand:- start:7478 stop:8410 length:933 start_codon:yes stop_codon:yes gene_type:complete